MQEPIELSSDEEEAVAAPVPAPAPAVGQRRKREDAAGSRDAAIEILSDDEEPALPPPTGRADEPVTLDDDDPLEREAQRRRKEAAACFLCESDRLRNAYKLGSCGHSFCRSCIAEYVERKLRRFLAHEVVCPTCDKQMTILDVQTLGTAGKDSRPHGMMPGMGHRAAQLLGYPGSGAGSSHGASSGGGGQRVAGSQAATKRLMREFQAIQKADTARDGFAVSMPDDTNLYTWDATFFKFERGTALAKDLDRVPGKHILLRVSFPSNYPTAPPYIRVIRPRFQYRTGHVTIGGSICTEMLTSAGWSSTMTIESVLLGIRTNMLEGGARLDLSNRRDYSEAEARDAFNRMVRDHGWW